VVWSQVWMGYKCIIIASKLGYLKQCHTRNEMWWSTKLIFTLRVWTCPWKIVVSCQITIPDMHLLHMKCCNFTLYVYYYKAGVTQGTCLLTLFCAKSGSSTCKWSFPLSYEQHRVRSIDLFSFKRLLHFLKHLKIVTGTNRRLHDLRKIQGWIVI
jgi:hypothetical protein